MAFGLKHLLVIIVYVSIGLAASVNADLPISNAIVGLLTLGTLTYFAYAIWTIVGEKRAFSVGFLIWVGIYYLLDVVSQSKYVNLSFGTAELLDALFGLFAPDRYTAAPHRLKVIGHPLFSLLFGFIGGWVTVYFYRKRQRMLSASAANN